MKMWELVERRREVGIAVAISASSERWGWTGVCISEDPDGGVTGEGVSDMGGEFVFICRLRFRSRVSIFKGVLDPLSIGLPRPPLLLPFRLPTVRNT
jgi:hypothetical protein